MFSKHATSDIHSVVRYPCIVREQGFGASLRPFIFRTRARGSFVVHRSKPERHQFQRGTLRSEIQARNSLELSKTWIQSDFLTCLASSVIAMALLLIGLFISY
jgi:hypothetical protein